MKLRGLNPDDGAAMRLPVTPMHLSTSPPLVAPSSRARQHWGRCQLRPLLSSVSHFCYPTRPSDAQGQEVPLSHFWGAGVGWQQRAICAKLHFKMGPEGHLLQTVTDNNVL